MTVPVRSRVALCAPVLRRRSALGVLRRRPPERGPPPGEADRGAVGRRAGRLPGRQLSHPLVRVERIYRDTMRDFWRGDATVAEFAAPSAALQTSTRARPKPFASVNSITATMGSRSATSSLTTMKHNEANGESNCDGSDDNARWNCGVEGPTDDPRSTRCGHGSSGTSWRRCCCHRACRWCSGRRVGEVAGRQQQRVVPGQRGLVVQLGVVRRRAARVREAADRARRRHPVFRRTRFFDGTGEQLPDVWWMRPDGRRMTRRDWENRLARDRRRS